MTDITDEPVVRWMKEAGIADASHPLVEMFRKVAELARQDEREACAQLCDELRQLWAAYKDTALLNGDIDLSNAASGEVRAAESLAMLIRFRGAK